MTESRIWIRNVRPIVYKARARMPGWVAYCPCMIPPMRKATWRAAIDGLVEHIKEIHL